MSQAAPNSNHKGRHVTSARALRFLFASGILGGHGRGKHREVGYNRKRAGQVKTMRARGLDVTSRKGFRRGGQGASRPGKPFSTFNSANAAAKRNKGFGRAVIGGGAAGLRGGGGHSASVSSRAERLAAGHAIANRPDVARRALKGSGLRVSEAKSKGAADWHNNGTLTASGKNVSLRGDTRFLVRTARKEGKVKERWTPHGSTRAARIAAGRAKAQAYLQSERGQHLREGVIGLTNASRRTGRRDFQKPEKIKAAKNHLRAAGVRIKTGEALARKGEYGLSRRLNGDYSGHTFTRDTPRLAAQKRQAAVKAERAAKREAVIAPVRGKSRAERIAAGRAVAANSIQVWVHQRRKEAAVREARQAATARRLTGRNNRVRRGEIKEARQYAEAQAQREAQRQQRLTARRKREGKVPQLERARRVKAGLKRLATFRQKRDSLYNGKLF